MNTPNPRIGVCAAFQHGFEVLEFIFLQGREIRFVATSKRDKSEYKDQIVQLCKDNEVEMFTDITGNEAIFVSFLRDENIDIVILDWWPTIISPEAITSVNVGWVNMHPSFLPYGRGKHAYSWSILEKTPHGVSIHFVDEGIDTGPILFQKEIEVQFTDTGQTLYEKGVEEVIKLFKENYERIACLDFQPIPQDDTIATSHHSKEIQCKREIDLSRKYEALELINLMRAYSFSDGPSLKVNLNGVEYNLRLSIDKLKKN